MNATTFKFKIGFKLFIGFSVLVLVFMISQWYAIRFMRDHSLNQVDTLMTEKSNTASLQVDSFFSQIDVYNDALGRLYTESTTSAKLITSGQFILENNSYIKSIVFLRSNGRELIKIEDEGKKVNEGLFFEIITHSFQQAALGESTISKVYFVNNQSGPFINVYTPIQSGNTVTAVIKMQLSLIKIWDVISQIKLGNTGHAYVVDYDGRLIAHENTDFVFESPILSSRNVISSALQNTRLNRWPDEFEYINEENISVVAKTTKVDRAGWVVVFEQSTAEAYQFINFLESFFTISLILSISAILIISYLLSQNIIHSIKQLKSGALRLEAEDLKSRIELHSGDEFEELSHTFNSMAAKLEKSFSQLEEQRLRSSQTAQQLMSRDTDLRVINDELQLEKDLIKIEKDKFMVVLSGITDAVIALDLDYKIVTFNASAEKLTGFKAAEAIGAPVDTILKIYDKDHQVSIEEYCPIQSTSDENIFFSKKYLKVVCGKKESFVNLVVGKIKGNKKSNLAGILSIHDLTEEQRLEEMKLDFVSMAAHELRTPLTSIRGYLTLYLDENKNILNDSQKFLLNRVDISSQQLGALVENLLSVSRIEKGAFSVNLKPVDWSNIIETTVEQLSVRAQEKKQSLTYDKPEKKIMVIADKLRITEVLTNLIANAISYTGENGSIHISIECDKTSVTTHIKDTGEGIATDSIPHLFTKFFRVSGTLSQGSKGTGLGLYISKVIVEKHKGTIWVKSEAGKGSTFSFSIPLSDQGSSNKTG